jgi:hypothetical protein
MDATIDLTEARPSKKIKLSVRSNKLIDIVEARPGDLVIQIGTNKELPLVRVHKAVLEFASHPFRIMLSGGFAEGARTKPYDEDYPLILPEDDHKPFIHMVRILHNALPPLPNTKIDLSSAKGVARVADKYDCAPIVLRYFVGEFQDAFASDVREYKNAKSSVRHFGLLNAAVVAALADDRSLFRQATRHAACYLRSSKITETSICEELRDLAPATLCGKLRSMFQIHVANASDRQTVS